MKEVINFSATFYYTDFILLVTGIIAFVISTLSINRDKKLALIPLYLLTSVLQTSFAFLELIYPEVFDQVKFSISQLLVSAFVLIEYYTIAHVFYEHISSKKIKKYITYASVLYLMIFCGYHLFIKSDRLEMGYFYLIHATFVLLPPALFIFWLFKSEPLFDLINLPPFWITIGAFICFLGTIPIFLIGSMIFDESSKNLHLELFAINNICYTIFFILIIRAIKCTKKTTI